jgi:hypothetical protein
MTKELKIEQLMNNITQFENAVSQSKTMETVRANNAMLEFQHERLNKVLAGCKNWRTV